MKFRIKNVSKKTNKPKNGWNIGLCTDAHGAVRIASNLQEAFPVMRSSFHKLPPCSEVGVHSKFYLRKCRNVQQKVVDKI